MGNTLLIIRVIKRVLVGKKLEEGKVDLRRVQHLFFFNLNIAYFMMIAYLTLIWYFDLKYKENFLLHSADLSWQSLGHLAGFLYLVSYEASMLFMVLVSADQFIKIKFLATKERIPFRVAVYMSLMVWLVAVLVGIIGISFAETYSDFYALSDAFVSLPLLRRPGQLTRVLGKVEDPLGNRSPYFSESKSTTSAWSFSILIFLVHNIQCHVVIIVFYRKISKMLKGIDKEHSKLREAYIAERDREYEEDDDEDDDPTNLPDDDGNENVEGLRKNEPQVEQESNTDETEFIPPPLITISDIGVIDDKNATMAVVEDISKMASHQDGVVDINDAVSEDHKLNNDRCDEINLAGVDQNGLNALEKGCRITSNAEENRLSSRSDKSGFHETLEHSTSPWSNNSIDECKSDRSIAFIKNVTETAKRAPVFIDNDEMAVGDNDDWLRKVEGSPSPRRKIVSGKDNSTTKIKNVNIENDITGEKNIKAEDDDNACRTAAVIDLNQTQSDHGGTSKDPVQHTASLELNETAPEQVINAQKKKKKRRRKKKTKKLRIQPHPFAHVQQKRENLDGEIDIKNQPLCTCELKVDRLVTSIADMDLSEDSSDGEGLAPYKETNEEKVAGMAHCMKAPVYFSCFINLLFIFFALAIQMGLDIDVIAHWWFAIVVLPLNATIVPLIYLTITSTCGEPEHFDTLEDANDAYERALYYFN